jgi:hypothetical protein
MNIKHNGTSQIAMNVLECTRVPYTDKHNFPLSLTYKLKHVRHVHSEHKVSTVHSQDYLVLFIY